MIHAAAPSPVLPAKANPKPAGPAGSGFALVLAGVGIAGSAPDEPPAAAPTAERRHHDADTGKTVPAQAEDDDTTADGALAWLPAMLPIPAPPVTPGSDDPGIVPAAQKRVPTDPFPAVPPGIEALALPEPTRASGPAQPAPTDATALATAPSPSQGSETCSIPNALLVAAEPGAPLTTTPPAGAPVPIIEDPGVVAAGADDLRGATGAAPAAATTQEPKRPDGIAMLSFGARARTIPAPVAPAGAALPAPVRTTPIVQPATQAFAAAIAQLSESRSAPREPGAPDAPPTATTAVQPAGILATAPVAPSQDTALDLRHEHWPHAMIDRIEALRDAADAVDTSIRLVPDALGPLDVAIRKEGDTVHVRFTAESAATRALIADAQPRLAEIAEQRGLRLGQSDVGGGGQHGQRPVPPAPLPAAPARVRADDDLPLADDRIA